ncbi:MAG TPA: endonuclease domain-containing protein [Anaerolineae bacterium]|nr:endonuclease domain-containing protein [Anaerolineae bacterium]
MPTPPPTPTTPWQPTPIPERLLYAARHLRQRMTDAQRLLWSRLRGRQMDGFRFRKQHPVERFVLDFYCPAAKLAIEVDGGQHNEPSGQARDAERTQMLDHAGIRVLRFWNHEVLGNLDVVMHVIWAVLHGAPDPRQLRP